MTKKRRKIRYDRLAAVILTPMFVAILIGCINFKSVKAQESKIQAAKIEFEPIKIEENLNVQENEGKQEKEEKEYLGEFLLTAYCGCEECSENWGKLTATGTIAEQGKTIAVDPNVIPYGSIVEIDGHRYIAEDCGGAINDKHIDVYMENHEDCFAEFCNGYHSVFIIKG